MNGQLAILPPIRTVNLNNFTPRRKKFILCMVEGENDQGQCAIIAGYGKGSHVRASELMRNTDVVQAISHFSLLRFTGLIGKATKKACDLIENGTGIAQSRMIKEVMDRTWGPSASKNAKKEMETVEGLLSVLDAEDSEALELKAEPDPPEPSMSERLAKSAKEYVKNHPV